MKVGDVLHLVPTLSEKIGLESKGAMPCQVVYIHPKGRFYVVEFGRTQRWREAFYPAEREGREYNQPVRDWTEKQKKRGDLR